MPALLAVLVVAAAAVDGGEVAALQQLWSGMRDSSEQVVYSTEGDGLPWPLQSERRVRTVVAPVKLPWLGAHVLYLEEFLEDSPEQPRRQLLLALEPADESARAVRARVYSLRQPGRWLHLNYRPQLLADLALEDLRAFPGCDLVLERQGGQFRGGTHGHDCLDGAGPVAARYLDYQLVIGADLYWYRRRLLRASDDELLQEIIGFDRFAPDELSLYSCRIAWSASGSPRELRPLTTLELYDQGGRAGFTTPDGRRLELMLHGADWPYAIDRDALILLLREAGSEAPVATAWAQMDTQRIVLDVGWLSVRCGALTPDRDDLLSRAAPWQGAAPARASGATPGPVRRYPSAAAG